MYQTTLWDLKSRNSVKFEVSSQGLRHGPRRGHGCMKNDREFRRHAGEAVPALFRRLTAASDDYAFDAAMADGSIIVTFDRPPGKLVISPQSAGDQVWVSTGRKSYKLDWDAVEDAFVLEETSQTLKELVEQVLSDRLGDDVSL